MELIAIKNIEVFSPNSKQSRTVKKGGYVGVLKSNNNDGSYTLASGEFVDEEGVAVNVANQKVQLQPVNTPVIPNKSTTETSTSKALKRRKIFSIAILIGGIAAFSAGKKGLGISLIVLSLIMIRHNFKQQ